MTDPDTRLALGFDTSGPFVCAALLRGASVLAHRREALARGQAERLLPLLEAVLRDAGLDWGAVEVLGVGIGPGNFTGIRISVAAARGLALALGCPAVGVSALEAQAVGLPRPCIATVAGRRGAVYAQMHGTDRADPPALLDADGIAGLPGGLAVTGEGAAGVAVLTGGAILAPTPLAIGIARLALARATAQPPRPAPLYLRAADAAPARDRPPALIG